MAAQVTNLDLFLAERHLVHDCEACGFVGLGILLVLCFEGRLVFWAERCQCMFVALLTDRASENSASLHSPDMEPTYLVLFLFWRANFALSTSGPSPLVTASCECTTNGKASCSVTSPAYSGFGGVSPRCSDQAGEEVALLIVSLRLLFLIDAVYY